MTLTVAKRDTALLQKLMPRHYRIIDLFIEGLTPGEVAKEVGMSVVQIKNIRNSPHFQLEYDRRRTSYERIHDGHLATCNTERAEDIIKKSQPEAARKLTCLLESVDEGIQLRSAESLLDRGGHARLQKIQSTNANVVVALDGDQLARIRETLDLDCDTLDVKPSDVKPSDVNPAPGTSDDPKPNNPKDGDPGRLMK